MRRPLILFPFLIAAFPILFLFSHNLGQASINQIFIPIAITIIFTLLFWKFLSFLTKDKKKAGLIVSLFILMFFSYGHSSNAIKGFHFVIGKITLGHNVILISIGCIFFLLGAFLIINNQRDLHNITNILNVVTVSLVAISLVNIGAYMLKSRALWKDNYGASNIESNPIISKETDIKPNIYYIILDAYARADILEEVYQFDNKEFLEYLTKKGFYVANKSRANYGQTSLSLASTLNFQYLDFFFNTINIESNARIISSNDRIPLRNLIGENKVHQFLKEFGYLFVCFSSGSFFTEIGNADIYINCEWSLDEFQNELINYTPIPLVFNKLSRFHARRKRILNTFEHLANMSRKKGPLFIFAHIIAPHTPFVFGENGEPTSLQINLTKLAQKTKDQRNEYIEGYKRQLIFINKKVQEMIDRIIINSPDPPIIILQSDHGPLSQLGLESIYKERMSILNAYYLPNNGQKLLYDNITPVNTFRIIFNYYFGANLKLLIDESYYSTFDQPYKFISVTNNSNSAVGIKRPE